MKPGSIQIVDRISAVEAIKQSNEDDLRFLNGLIVERLRLIAQARATALMTSFARGDRVGFQAPDGRMLEGFVLRLNKKTVGALERSVPVLPIYRCLLGAISERGPAAVYPRATREHN